MQPDSKTGEKQGIPRPDGEKREAVVRKR
jgi:hypothetical protein